MARTIILFVALLALVESTDAAASVILYQNSFDTDTTDIPGTYSPFAFNPDEADVSAAVESGVVRISRSLTGPTNSVPYALSELTLSSQDLLGTNAFPSVFSISTEIGGTPGNESWWGPMITFDDTIHSHIQYHFHPGWSGNNFRVCNEQAGCFDTSATSALFPTSNALFPVEITLTQLVGSYQFDIDLTDPGTSQIYSDTLIVPYEWDISTIGLVRQGHGGGDVMIDNLTISTPVPEPSTALLITLGLVGFAVRRNRDK